MFWRLSGAVIVATAVPVLNNYVKNLNHWTALVFAVLYGISQEEEVVVPGVLLFVALRGYTRFFVCSILLVDVIFINERLKNVVQAVIRPVNDIVATFVLMVFVVFIFASFGIYEYGQTMLGGTAGDVELCPNLAFCFLEILDSGLRSGDVVGESFSHLTHEDGVLAWIWRIFYGLAFFLVIGVILFDIVTGTIIDTFGSLREERVSREDNLLNTSFISGISRSTCDEKNVDFDELNEVHQNMWNYVYLLAHLKTKAPEDYTGAESYIATKIHEQDISWLPENHAWIFQQKEEEQAIKSSQEDTVQKNALQLEDMLERFKQMQDGFSRLDIKVSQLYELQSAARSTEPGSPMKARNALDRQEGSI